MASFTFYSEEEKKLLLDELKTAGNHITADNMKIMEELWPGFFNGLKRNAYSLFLETVKLAKERNIEYVIDSIPLRIRNRTKEKSDPSTRFTKTKFYEQILAIIQSEIQLAQKKATARILKHIENIIVENIEMREELKGLRPYKVVVENSYKRELTARREV